MQIATQREASHSDLTGRFSLCLSTLEDLSRRGVDVTELQTALRMGDTKGILLALPKDPDTSKVEFSPLDKAHLTSMIESARKQILHQLISDPIFARSGIAPIPDSPLAGGGFNWVVQVNFNGATAALTVPKYLADDYEQRNRVRAAVSKLIPDNLTFDVPRVLAIGDSPFPFCAMTFVQGKNCFPLTFNPQGQPHTDDEGRRTGNSVFNTLGRMAAQFGTIESERFGLIVNQSYGTPAEYIAPYIRIIEEKILGSDGGEVTFHGLDRALIKELVTWVTTDSRSQFRGVFIHPDLSPWNMLRDPTKDRWAITDGDDARFGLRGEQLGVCLMSMRGNLNREWIDALLDGYGARSQEERRGLLRAAAAYGAVTYGLQGVAEPMGQGEKKEHFRDIALRFVSPLLQIFKENY
jgi:hypothetical protein